MHASKVYTQDLVSESTLQIPGTFAHCFNLPAITEAQLARTCGSIGNNLRLLDCDLCV
jgi:hypothetical protein